MTVVNEHGEAVAQVREVASGRLLLSAAPAGLEAFPDVDGDGRRSLTLTVVGPGDRLTFHYPTRQLSAR